MGKSAAEQLQAKKSHKLVVLDKDFAGVKAGNTLFVATPQIVDRYVQQIPYGQTRSIERMRNELARRWKANATCPVSAAIFLRISAQAAVDQMSQGRPAAEVTPFWRILTSADKIAKKLSIDGEWIDHQRALEAG